MHQPKLLLLDEPTSGLDPLNQQEFYNILQEIRREGTSVFFSTHILDEAENLCDDIGIIKDGKLLDVLHIDELRQKYIRNISLETSAEIKNSDFPSNIIHDFKTTPGGYSFTTRGKIGKLLGVLAKYPIDDIKISEAKLEEIFMNYYSK